jgi:glutamine cyclotransferase
MYDGYSLFRKKLGCFLAVFLLTVCGSSSVRAQDAHDHPTVDPDRVPAGVHETEVPVRYTYQVVNRYPHDPEAFVQGLVVEKDCFYESTGLHGRSSVRKVAIESGEVLRKHSLAPTLFGEGLAIYDGALYQLTWRSGFGFVYDKEHFGEIRRFSYETQGWGLTDDGKNLIMSDGSSQLYFRDPETFTAKRTITVHDHKGPVQGLNELEYVRGKIYANVIPSDRIACIDAQTGQVTAWIDLGGLLSVSRRDPARQVLNGIAYHAEEDRLFVTGKCWPYVFEIELVAEQ